MATVEKIIKELSGYDLKEHLLVIYWSKELCKEWVIDELNGFQELHNLTDEETQKMFDNAWEYVTDDTYETPDVGEAIITSLKESLLAYSQDLSLEELNDETELWDKEITK